MGIPGFALCPYSSVGTPARLAVCPWPSESTASPAEPVLLPGFLRWGAAGSWDWMDEPHRSLWWLWLVLPQEWLCSAPGWQGLLPAVHRGLCLSNSDHTGSWQLLTEHEILSVLVFSKLCSFPHQTHSDASGAKGLGYIFFGAQLLLKTAWPKYWLIKYIFSGQPSRASVNFKSAENN